MSLKLFVNFREQAGRPKCPLDPYFIIPDKCKCIDYQVYFSANKVIINKLKKRSNTFRGSTVYVYTLIAVLPSYTSTSSLKGSGSNQVIAILSKNTIVK